MISRPSSRRAVVDRWIASLNPLFEVITSRAQSLGLGEPRLQVGPTFLKGDLSTGDRIRRGAVWFINGRNTGFHVDFFNSGIRVDAWSGMERRASAWVHGKVTENSLRTDLASVLAAAGLADCAKSNEVRQELFRMATSEGKPGIGRR